MTKEAEKTTEEIGKFFVDYEMTDCEKTNFVILVLQVKSRKVTVQNQLFKIEWNILVTVS